MEMAAEEEVYKIDRITNTKWLKGERMYLVLWEGYSEKESTWEPMQHLIGCAAQIREFEQKREKEDQEAKEEILRVRRERKEKAAADAEAD